MSTLIFLLTIITIVILLVTATVRAIRRQPILKIARWSISKLLGYSLVWVCFWLARWRPDIPLGTDIFFDDWCATIDKVKQLPAASRDSAEFILAITMSNHSRGIAQRPSEPRIHLIDDRGRIWSKELYRIYELENVDINKINIAGFNHPEDAEFVKSEMEISRTTKQPHDFYYRIILPGNAVKILHAKGQVITDETGEAEIMLGTLQDATKQKSIKKN